MPGQPVIYPQMTGQPVPVAMPPMQPPPMMIEKLCDMPAGYHESNDENERRQLLGTHLYAIIEKDHAENAAKVTGMLLDQPLGQIESYFNNKQLFNNTVTQAINMLES